MTPPYDEKPLEGWKEIAKHLGRGERTAQRWEKKGLPVHRHPGSGVIAYRAEIDGWIKRCKEPSGPAIPIREPVCDSDPQPPARRAASANAAWRRYGLLSAGLALAVVTMTAILAHAYGLAILSLWIGVLFTLARLGVSAIQRVWVALYLIAAMAYTCSGSTMPEFQDTVINSDTLAPTAAFLFVLGLKFIPLFVLVLASLVAARTVGLPPGWQKPYTALGMVFLAVEFVFLGLTSGDDAVWKAGIPARWPLLIASAAVLVLNVVVWQVARRYLSAGLNDGLRWFLLIGGTAYLGVVGAAAVVDHEHNLINRYYLDARWPEAYVASNPQAIRSFRGTWPKDLKNEIGPDLASLLSDAGFIEALNHGRFYKQHSDEPFQLFHRAVIYSYRPTAASPSGPSAFVTIRFPKELADALRFEPVDGQ